MGRHRICITAPQVPYLRGGAEILVEQLARQLGARGHTVEVVTMPFVWTPTRSVLEQALAWRLADMTAEVLGPGSGTELIIATKFPSYLARHPNKVVWKVHLQREIYDLHATPFGPLSMSEQDRGLRQAVIDLDLQALGEARSLFAISNNVVDRLERYCGLEATCLYPPPKLQEALRPGPFGDYLLYFGRLDAIKRVDMALAALAETQRPVRLKIAGRGPEQQRLQKEARRLGIDRRVDFLGFVDDEELVDLVAGCCGVILTPLDEDYGFTTLEAFLAGKPVVTTSDAGGVLEFVEDGVNGFIVAPDAVSIAARIDELDGDRALAERLGASGRARIEKLVSWDRVVDSLTATLE